MTNTKKIKLIYSGCDYTTGDVMQERTRYFKVYANAVKAYESRVAQEMKFLDDCNGYVGHLISKTATEAKFGDGSRYWSIRLFEK